MANSYRTSMNGELDEIHRLLPREILEDIGIVVNTAEQQALDVVIEDLAAQLASVLGGAPKKTSYHHHHHPQANVGHGMGGRMDALAPAWSVPPFLPLPAAAVPWHVMEGLVRNNNIALHRTATMPGFAAPARPPLLAGGTRPAAATTTAVCRGVGTGVFLPRRAEVARRTAKAPRPAPPPSSGSHGRMIHPQRGQQAAMVIVGSQQVMRAVAAHMERRSYYLGVRPHPGPALPQEWTC